MVRQGVRYVVKTVTFNLNPSHPLSPVPPSAGAEPHAIHTEQPERRRTMEIFTDDREENELTDEELDQVSGGGGYEVGMLVKLNCPICNQYRDHYIISNDNRVPCTVMCRDWGQTQKQGLP